MLSSIHIEGFEFYAYHGVSPAEQEVGHRFVIDLVLETEERASKTDDVADTVDYGKVMELVNKVATGNRFHTVERLDAEILKTILDRFPSVEAAEGYLRKIAPPAPFMVQEVGVHMRRERPPRRG